MVMDTQTRTKKRTKKRTKTKQTRTKTKQTKTKQTRTKQTRTRTRTRTDNKFGRDMVYLFKSDYVPESLVSKIFTNLYGTIWKPYNESTKTVPNFTHLDGKFNRDKMVSNVYSMLRNVVDDNKYTIANKSNLYNNIKKYGIIKNNLVKQIDIDIKKIYMQNDNINKYRKYFNDKNDKNDKNGNVWIFKPVGGYSGQYIKVFNEFNQFAKYVKNMIHLHRSRFNKNDKIDKIGLSLSKDFASWVLQEYIDNTLLINERKFHMRVYLLYYNRNNIKTGYVSNIYEIALAREPYIQKNYGNSGIHDTHFYEGTMPLYFPRDFPFDEDIKNNVMQQVKSICNCLIKETNAKCYPDALNCFEVFGVDLMVDTNNNVKLIEVNTKIGYPKPDSDPINFCEKLITGIIETVVNDFYPDIKKNKSTTPFFIPL